MYTVSEVPVEPLTTLIRDEPEDLSCPSASWFHREGPECFKKKKKSSSTIQNSLTGSQVAERAIYLWINNTKRYLSRGFDQQDVVKSLLQPLVVLYLSHNINISRWKKANLGEPAPRRRLVWAIPSDWTPGFWGWVGQRWRGTAQRWCFCVETEAQLCTWPPAGRPPGRKHRHLIKITSWFWCVNPAGP